VSSFRSDRQVGLPFRAVKSADYILGSGSNTSAIVGGILEITIALAGPVAAFEFSPGI
jgi:hypothetical protein